MLPIRSSFPLEEELKQSSLHFGSVNRNSYGSMGELSPLAEISPSQCSGPPGIHIFLASMCKAPGSLDCTRYSSGTRLLIPTALLALRIHPCFLSSRSEISVPGLNVTRDSKGRSSSLSASEHHPCCLSDYHICMRLLLLRAQWGVTARAGGLSKLSSCFSLLRGDQHQQGLRGGGI